MWNESKKIIRYTSISPSSTKLLLLRAIILVCYCWLTTSADKEKAPEKADPVQPTNIGSSSSASHADISQDSDEGQDANQLPVHLAANDEENPENQQEDPNNSNEEQPRGRKRKQKLKNTGAESSTHSSKGKETGNEKKSEDEDLNTNSPVPKSDASTFLSYFKRKLELKKTIEQSAINSVEVSPKVDQDQYNSASETQSVKSSNINNIDKSKDFRRSSLPTSFKNYKKNQNTDLSELPGPSQDIDENSFNSEYFGVPSMPIPKLETRTSSEISTIILSFCEDHLEHSELMKELLLECLMRSEAAETSQCKQELMTKIYQQQFVMVKLYEESKVIENLVASQYMITSYFQYPSLIIRLLLAKLLELISKKSKESGKNYVKKLEKLNSLIKSLQRCTTDVVINNAAVLAEHTKQETDEEVSELPAGPMVKIIKTILPRATTTTIVKYLQQNKESGIWKHQKFILQQKEVSSPGETQTDIKENKKIDSKQKTNNKKKVIESFPGADSSSLTFKMKPRSIFVVNDYIQERGELNKIFVFLTTSLIQEFILFKERLIECSEKESTNPRRHIVITKNQKKQNNEEKKVIARCIHRLEGECFALRFTLTLLESALTRIVMYLDQVLEFDPNTGLPLEITFGEGYPQVYKDLFKLIKMTGRQFLSDRIRYGNEENPKKQIYPPEYRDYGLKELRYNLKKLIVGSKFIIERGETEEDLAARIAGKYQYRNESFGG